MECSENEKKAQEEYDKIYEGMKEVNDKMKVITDAKKEKETACKKIVKYVFQYSLIDEGFFFLFNGKVDFKWEFLFNLRDFYVRLFISLL